MGVRWRGRKGLVVPMTVSAATFWGGARFVDATAFAVGHVPVLRFNRERAAVLRIRNTNPSGRADVRLPAMPAPWHSGPFYGLIVNAGTADVRVQLADGTTLATVPDGEAVVIHRRGDQSAESAAGWVVVPFDPDAASADSVSRSNIAVAVPPAVAGVDPTNICVYFALVDTCLGVFDPIYTYAGFSDGVTTQADLGQYVGTFIRLELAPGSSPETNDEAVYEVQRREYFGQTLAWEVVALTDIVAQEPTCDGIKPPPTPACSSSGATCTPVSCAGSLLAASVCDLAVEACPASPLYSELLAIEPDGVWDTRLDFDADYASALGVAAVTFCGCRFEYRTAPSVSSPGRLTCESRRILCYLEGEYAECWTPGSGLVPAGSADGCPGGRLECCCLG